MNVMNIVDTLMKKKCEVGASKNDDGSLTLRVFSEPLRVNISTTIPAGTTDDRAILIVDLALREAHNKALDKIKEELENNGR